MTNYLKITIFIFAIIPFSIVYFCWLFGFYDALKEFVEKIVWFIIFGGLAYKMFTIFMDWCMSRASEYSPTPQVESSEKAPEPTPDQKKGDMLGQSRGEDQGFDFSKYKPGSPEAASAYKNSQEFKDNQYKLRTLDALLDDARKQVGAQ